MSKSQKEHKGYATLLGLWEPEYDFGTMETSVGILLVVWND